MNKSFNIQIGDTVECIAFSVSTASEEREYANNTRKRGLEIGKKYKVTKSGDAYYGDDWVDVVGNGVTVTGTSIHQFKKINNSLTLKPMNNIISLLKTIARCEPEKTFIKLGFLDENEEITERGKAVLIHLLWQEKKEELKKIADQINQHEKEDNK